MQRTQKIISPFVLTNWVSRNSQVEINKKLQWWPLSTIPTARWDHLGLDHCGADSFPSAGPVWCTPWGIRAPPDPWQEKAKNGKMRQHWKLGWWWAKKRIYIFHIPPQMMHPPPYLTSRPEKRKGGGNGPCTSQGTPSLTPHITRERSRT